MATISGVAAGVPFTALPPAGAADGPAPMIVTWHMLDAPRTDAAFAAALPMTGVPAWRVHLGMPLCGARMVDGRLDAHIERAREDAVRAYFAPVIYQAVEEFPPALAALRERLPVEDGPISVLGASLGGAVALRVLADPPAPIRAVALVNPGLRVRTAVGLVAGMLGQPYRWTDETRTIADDLDFIARAAELPTRQPVLLVSGEQDHPQVRSDAVELIAALRVGYARPDEVELVTVPGLEHSLADEPGLEPAPQLPATRVVDEHLTEWFIRQLTAR
jgi:pimeloyl-ACP methyl ester carboxylesterase